ncbi:hypothetical protein M4V62_42135 [Streptomyces durmitorensis]|uniref:Uncharacterized protein n=1 Tax=Streptomyces durmitorensis TaxID=319947 RepID=A0ABY4Q6Y0_9ACTN|nr:hypothetical protein [Streptomyces durmitorensis]UQT61150.1 hypothetical protein M4V62_42135 [Streptomyces durmitorensis]
MPAHVSCLLMIAAESSTAPAKRFRTVGLRIWLCAARRLTAPATVEPRQTGAAIASLPCRGDGPTAYPSWRMRAS